MIETDGTTSLDVVAPTVVMDIRDDELPTDRFLDREASWLAFNQRVLALAQDPATPLLERARFLAIFSGNLDEFFMVRVAGLKRRIATGLAVPSPSGLLPREVLTLISSTTRKLVAEQAACFCDVVLPALRDEGIEIVRWPDLEETEQERLHDLFRERVFPVLTPLAVDPAHPFPYISGLSLNLAVVVRDPVSEAEHFARVKVPPVLPRLITLQEQAPGGRRSHRFALLDDVIAEHLPQLFQGMEVLAHHAFRVTRNADLEVDEDDVENLLQALERELVRRRLGPPVRLEVDETMDEHVLDLLMRELGISEQEVYTVPGPLDLTMLHAVADLAEDRLRYPAFLPVTHPALADIEPGQPADIFARMRAADILVHHPYDSFATSVQAFLEHAAADPDVLAIKQTLYRTSGDSPVVDALIDAAEAGKQVLVLVEIKARFDEQANIRWARALEEAGCHVVYGIVGLKTHCKIALVVRRRSDGLLERYVHVGTGNYNPKTARTYEDLGLLTANPSIGVEVTDLFNQLSGYSRRDDYRSLLVAPRSLRARLVSLIETQQTAAERGQPSGIVIKVNSLVDEEIVDALYCASRSGVPIDLVVRGICTLRPGVPGLSETIRVRSILGRFLEHSRAFCFGAGDAREVWIGSADLMHRNLDRRVEVAVRVDGTEARERLLSTLDLATAPDIARWDLAPDGGWQQAPGRDLQEELIRATRQRTAIPVGATN